MVARAGPWSRPGAERIDQLDRHALEVGGAAGDERHAGRSVAGSLRESRGGAANAEKDLIGR